MTSRANPRRAASAVAPALARTALALGAAGALTLVGSGVAFAHVTAQPGTAEKGGYATVSFRVPSELPTAGTVKLEVTLPVDHPIVSARTEPFPGWTAQVVKQPLPTPVDRNGAKITEAVRTVTWTAQPGTRLGPTEFAEFKVSLGRLPDDVDELVFPTVQSYDDGTVVRWDQPTPAGGEEPEHPAPTLKLVEPAGDVHGHGGHGAAPQTSGHAHATAAADHTARWLGGAGLLVGALGVGLGVGAVARTRRSRS